MSIKSLNVFRHFSIPSGKQRGEMRREWIHRINRADPKNETKFMEPPKSAVVCSDHFIDGFPTKRNPYPTLKLRPEKTAASSRGQMFKKLRIPGPSVEIIEQKSSSKELVVEIYNDSCPPDDTYESSHCNKQVFYVPGISNENSMSNHHNASLEAPAQSNDVAAGSPRETAQDLTLPVTRASSVQPSSPGCSLNEKSPSFSEQSENTTQNSNSEWFRKLFAWQETETGAHKFTAFRFINHILLDVIRTKNDIIREQAQQISSLEADKESLRENIRNQSNVLNSRSVSRSMIEIGQGDMLQESCNS